MELRVLGSTGLRVSAIAFGAGPVPATMTSGDADAQTAVIARALELGVNWFDTAAGYGQGKSEAALGAALSALGAGDRVHVATKVRLTEDDLADVAVAIRRSVGESLERLRLSRVTLLQLHNSITARRGDEPTSLTAQDVLGPRGVLETFEQLKSEGLVAHTGLTGIGQADALREVIRSGRFATLQIPYNLLNASAGRAMPQGFAETDYGNVIADCSAAGMGVFAIRVLAGGALASQPPSAHTLKTPFFPMPLYERDLTGAARLRDVLAGRISVPEAAVRFALSHPAVTAAIIGFSDPSQVDDAVAWAGRGLLQPELLAAIA
jgi:aryl-alcohol dehydrogenase-like predicted oxidoreductase